MHVTIRKHDFFTFFFFYSGFINRPVLGQWKSDTHTSRRTNTHTHTHTQWSVPPHGCRAGGVSLELEHWKPRCSCSQGVPSFCMGAGMGLNDGRLGGGRDGRRLMCRQRRSLLRISGSITRRLQCETGQKWPGTVAQMLKHRIIIIFFFFCPHRLNSENPGGPSVRRCNLV